MRSRGMAVGAAEGPGTGRSFHVGKSVPYLVIWIYVGQLWTGHAPTTNPRGPNTNKGVANANQISHHDQPPGTLTEYKYSCEVPTHAQRAAVLDFRILTLRPNAGCGHHNLERDIFAFLKVHHHIDRLTFWVEERQRWEDAFALVGERGEIG
eukprot:2823453-Prymnesium_polylepis.1